MILDRQAGVWAYTWNRQSRRQPAEIKEQENGEKQRQISHAGRKSFSCMQPLKLSFEAEFMEFAAAQLNSFLPDIDRITITVDWWRPISVGRE